jgi:glycosyltransferase involved in cell wall biosynthesis
MNVLFIGTTDILGGAAKISWTLKEFLESEGCTVSMFVADKRSGDPKVKVIPRQIWRKYLGFLLATDDLLYSDWILNTEEFKRADIIHCHNLHGRFFNLKTLQKMSKIKPVIWTLHDEWAITPHCAYTFEGEKMKNGLYICQSIHTPPRLLWNNTKYLSWRKNMIYKSSKLHIITPSEWLHRKVKNTILGRQDVRTIHNGIETQVFKIGDKIEARKKLNLPKDKKIILFLADDAKNNPWKGWTQNEKIINSEKFEDALFLCVGNHHQHSNEENVEYRGQISDKKILSLYYNAADVLLFTSLAENFPLVILEAMSSGLPIVAFNVGGVSEVLTHQKNGYIASYGNLEEISAGLNWILNLTPGERERIKITSSLKIKNNFDITKMNSEYMNLYKEIISNHEKNR